MADINQFPLVNKYMVQMLRIGIEKGEDLEAYLKRCSKPEHDDKTHEFRSSKIVPGQCEECGWFHPELCCAECGDPLNKHITMKTLEELLGDLYGKGIVIVIPLRKPPEPW